ncbi:MAG: hypothetical protein JW947_09050 [Sedimentisphaerales bacterium]|nr:hypothetical protein [Sedimentisphaerales bacterium]
MVTFSKDADILKYEPVLFGELHLPWQVLAAGTNGATSGTTFTSVGADFVNAQIEAGDVIYITDGSNDGAYEIISVDSATQLTVSVLRSDSEGEPIPPPAWSAATYRISTFSPQAAEVAEQLTEYFSVKPGNPASEIDSEDILYPEQLRRASVFAVLSSVYAMLAGSSEDEYLWKKSTYYQKLFDKAIEKCKISVDTDGDGVADDTKTGSDKKLSRD